MQCWSQAASSLDEFIKLRSDKAGRDVVLTMNRLLADLPETNDRDDASNLYDVLNPIKGKFVPTVESIKEQAEKEVK